MKNKVESKTFNKALILFSKHTLEVKKCLQDQRLTNSEKAILKAYLYLRDNKLEKALDLASSVSEGNSEAVLFQKFLILGIIYNNLGDYKLAKAFINKALENKMEDELNHFIYIAYHNSFIISLNEQNTGELKRTLAKLSTIKLTLNEDKLAFKRLQFNYLTKIEDFEEASFVMDELESSIKFLEESDRITFLLDKFNFYIAQSNLDECVRIHQNMKKFRKFQLTENFKYIKILLNNLVKNKPIYFYEKDFKRVPPLDYQLNVIKALEEGKLELATFYWKKLQYIKPICFKADFVYEGYPTLFKFALDSYLYKTKNNDVVLDINDEGLSQHELILKILKRKNGIDKDELFTLVYGRIPKSKSDYQTLAKCLYRLKKKIDEEIIQKKGQYYIKKIA